MAIEGVSSGVRVVLFLFLDRIHSVTCMFASSQASRPPHEGDVSKPRKLSEPRKPQTQEEAVWDLRGHRVRVHRMRAGCAEGVRAGGAALRLKATSQPQPAGISAS